MTRWPIAKPTPALTEPTIITWMPERRSESRVTRPFAAPTEKRASSVHVRLTTSATVQREEEVRPERDNRRTQVGCADHDRVAEGGATGVGREPEFLFNFRSQKDVGIRSESSRDRLGPLAGQAFALEDDGELSSLARWELVDLASFSGDLGGVELLLGLAGEERATAHRDRAGNRLGKTGDDDERAGRTRGRHTGHDPERNQETILRAEHELADAGEATDPRGLAKRMVGDVALRLGSNIVAGWKALLGDRFKNGRY